MPLSISALACGLATVSYTTTWDTTYLVGTMELVSYALLVPGTSQLGRENQMDRTEMKYVAWGASKLLWLYKTHLDEIKFSYVVETAPKSDRFMDLPLHAAEILEKESNNCTVVIFAVSNATMAVILGRLAAMGRGLGHGVMLYADLLRDDFKRHLKTEWQWEADERLYRYSSAFTLNSLRRIHTTICGSWLFLEALRRTAQVPGVVAEVGAYQGGNALCASLSPVWAEKDYYIFDSFEGFPEISANDPQEKGAGTYAVELFAQEIRNSFSALPEVKIIQGFVPETFSLLPEDSRFSLVFYDCDLYQPALDTFSYCWDRLSEGGILLVHDYFSEPGGFAGVKKATDEFFTDRPIKVSKFFHNTMAAMVKS